MSDVVRRRTAWQKVNADYWKQVESQTTAHWSWLMEQVAKDEAMTSGVRATLQRILSLHIPERAGLDCAVCLDKSQDTHGYKEDWTEESWPCPTVRAIESIYLGPPGFQHQLPPPPDWQKFKEEWGDE